jgi:hypothetical protein
MRLYSVGTATSLWRGNGGSILDRSKRDFSVRNSVTAGPGAHSDSSPTITGSQWLQWVCECSCMAVLPSAQRYVLSPSSGSQWIQWVCEWMFMYDSVASAQRYVLSQSSGSQWIQWVCECSCMAPLPSAQRYVLPPSSESQWIQWVCEWVFKYDSAASAQKYVLSPSSGSQWIQWVGVHIKVLMQATHGRKGGNCGTSFLLISVATLIDQRGSLRHLPRGMTHDGGSNAAVCLVGNWMGDLDAVGLLIHSVALKRAVFGNIFLSTLPVGSDCALSPPWVCCT